MGARLEIRDINAETFANTYQREFLHDITKQLGVTDSCVELVSVNDILVSGTRRRLGPPQTVRSSSGLLPAIVVDLLIVLSSAEAARAAKAKLERSAFLPVLAADLDNIDLASQITMDVALRGRRGAAGPTAAADGSGHHNRWLWALASVGCALIAIALGGFAVKARLLQREEDLKALRHVSLGRDEEAKPLSRTAAPAARDTAARNEVAKPKPTLASRLAETRVQAYAASSDEKSTQYF